VYAIWSAADPLPFLASLFLHVIPDLIRTALHAMRKRFAGGRETPLEAAQ
jgi:hypothetical protein